jgi:hypothetical protein
MSEESGGQDTLHLAYAIKSAALLDLGRTITGKMVRPRQHYLRKP